MQQAEDKVGFGMRKSLFISGGRRASEAGRGHGAAGGGDKRPRAGRQAQNSSFSFLSSRNRISMRGAKFLGLAAARSYGS